MPDNKKDVQLNWLKEAPDSELRRYVMNNNRRILDLNKLALFIVKQFPDVPFDPKKGEAVDVAIKIMEDMKTRLEDAENSLDAINDMVST